MGKNSSIEEIIERLEAGEAECLGISLTDYQRWKERFLAEIDRLSSLKVVETAQGERDRRRRKISDTQLAAHTKVRSRLGGWPRQCFDREQTGI